MGNKRNKRGKKNKPQNPNAKAAGFAVIQPVSFNVPREEYDKFLAFCRIKDQLITLADDLEQAWNEHCIYLVQELQVEPPVIGPEATIEDNIGKMRESLRTFKYVENVSNRKSKKKKKNAKWFVPLSGGNTGTIHTVKPNINSAKDKDKNKTKKIQKAEVKLEHISTQNGKAPLEFCSLIKVTETDVAETQTEATSLQQIIDEIERTGSVQGDDYGICHHGNCIPCPICDKEKYPYCD